MPLTFNPGKCWKRLHECSEYDICLENRDTHYTAWKHSLIQQVISTHTNCTHTVPILVHNFIDVYNISAVGMYRYHTLSHRLLFTILLSSLFILNTSLTRVQTETKYTRHKASINYLCVCKTCQYDTATKPFSRCHLI